MSVGVRCQILQDGNRIPLEAPPAAVLRINTPQTMIHHNALGSRGPFLQPTTDGRSAEVQDQIRLQMTLRVSIQECVHGWEQQIISHTQSKLRTDIGYANSSVPRQESAGGLTDLLRLSAQPTKNGTWTGGSHDPIGYGL
jgi:hypothetical protein